MASDDAALIDDSPTTMREFDMIRQLRGVVGLFDGAMPVSPKTAWIEALRRTERLKQFYDDVRFGLQQAER